MHTIRALFLYDVYYLCKIEDSINVVRYKILKHTKCTFLFILVILLFKLLSNLYSNLFINSLYKFYILSVTNLLSNSDFWML